MAPISVLLVDDSPIALEILEQLLESSPEIKVVGTATSGKQALEMIPKLQPAVICTDLKMAEMDGLEFTKQVMAKYPRPILVISIAVQKEDTSNIFELLRAGALDVFPKPKTGLESDYQQSKLELVTKIKILAGVSVFTRPLRSPVEPTAVVKKALSAIAGTPSNGAGKIRIVAIGASTGGPQVLQKILSPLPGNFPVPIICVLHISPGFLQGMVDWLASECQMRVKVAPNGEIPSPGTIYFAPEGSHLGLDTQGRFQHTIAAPVDGHCPSVTFTFQSVAHSYGKAAAGVLLTGMGRDGADGMKAIAQAGGTTVAQDEASCVVFGMPKEAIALGAAQHILAPPSITTFLLNNLLSQ